MEKQRLVLVGNGMAGVRCIEEILALAPERFDITIIGSEPHPNYNRIMLSKVLQGDTGIEDIVTHDWSWYRERGINLLTGETVVGLDRAGRTVSTDRGRVISYDKLILATGSLPFMLPLPGADKPGVTAFRDIKDCETMIEAAAGYRKAAVIGGGLLGLEAARGLLNLGMEVDVVHINGYLMERQLDTESGTMLQRELERQGMRFLLEKQTERIYGRKRAEGLQFRDGSKAAADLIVMAVGVRPNVKLAQTGGLEVNRAIVVNDRMETSEAGIYAVGECAEHRGMVYGLVAPLYEQGKVLAKAICGEETPGYKGSILYSQLKVSGVEVFSAGEIRDNEVDTCLKQYNGIKGTYKKVTVKNGRIAGAVLFGDSSEGSKWLNYIKQGADAKVLDEEAAAGAGGSGLDAAAALKDTDTVCSCNSVTKGTIISAVMEERLETVEEVKACTRASGSCGGCKPLVEAVLRYALEHADEAGAGGQPPMCGCTGLSDGQAREAIRSGGWAGAEEAMAALGWNELHGCKVCRPAIRYYTAVFGREYSIGGGEKLADGSIVLSPRFYGGVVDARQLRRLAELMEQYEVPLAKLSADGGLDLLGLSPELAGEMKPLLPEAVRTASYGHPIGPVATCRGLGYEEGAIQDSVRLGAELEKRVAGLEQPAPVRIAVSSSPLHPSGTLSKDIGLVGVPEGYELYVGGQDGRLLREGELLCTGLSAEGAVDMTAALLMLYRETAAYGERVHAWVERQGIIQLREMLFDPDLRSGLLARLGLMMERLSVNDKQPASAAMVR
ncbi:NAD(P)/FAD-dependent oxidoreductase [Paenibacillus sambharensis]|uniref:NAD(P)/FAD-dependent oxidoreductase n=1 Tax=Paenibacillus sambharensis TaxID=1803190 RepID=A0A2W1LLP5_9BACL|nr:nitrite reductase large subunit NirB [Paenibacillus sambharensis]PZD95434.1 NAD(P)/FAD-dependent oxidoreductase [Paenibacillus sambharensis]